MFRKANPNNQNGNVNFILYQARIKNFQVFEILDISAINFLKTVFLGKKCVRKKWEQIFVQ